MRNIATFPFDLWRCTYKGARILLSADIADVRPTLDLGTGLVADTRKWALAK